MTVKTVGALLGVVLVGNLAILALSWWARHTTPSRPVVTIEGVDNLRAVDAKLWRGAAPTDAGYGGLAANGVTAIVDLRAEEGAGSEDRLVESLGMRYVHLPVRDGQIPSSEQIGTFLQAVDASPGTVFVHCGAGVGRTGAMVGAYTVASGEGGRKAALKRNLAVGPPTLEQLAFVALLDPDEGFDRPWSAVTAVSRLLDFPRRGWHVLGL